MKRGNYKRLSKKERVTIEVLLREGRSQSYISKVLSRSRSTINREVRKWVRLPQDMYDSELADFEANEYRHYKGKRPRIEREKKLRLYVYRGLKKGHSPELISGRLHQDYPKDETMRLSHESIYKHIYSHPQGRVNKQLIQCLPHHHSRRRKWKKRGKAQGIKNRTSIEQRPEAVNLRVEFGHLEGDLIVGKNQGSYICSLVERVTRFTCLFLLPDKKSETLQRQMIEALGAYPSVFRRSMTYDNGTEMANHEQISKQLGMSIYFAHPYSSWERGTNENTNGLVRRFLPKKTDFRTISKEQLKGIENWLNDRPRKVLGYLTPREAYYKELSKASGFQNGDNIN